MTEAGVKLMRAEDFQELVSDIKTVFAADPTAAFAILGNTALSYDIIHVFRAMGVESRIIGIYCDNPVSVTGMVLKPYESLRGDHPAVAIVASDELKEDILTQASPHLAPATKIVLAGYSHFKFRDKAYDTVLQETLVPSLANGYPHTLVHLYQCLANAARLNLEGVVAEFGMFKGGTTMMLSRFVELLGKRWKVIGFDTFAGFPKKRHCLDMYAHPGCVFHNETDVRQYLAARQVEIVVGDLVVTAARLAEEKVILAFIDTDNFSSASAVLDVVQDRVVPCGAIVFDHFTGRNRFRYTLGERIAASRLLADSRYFNLHDTGVFFRQR
jgi:hypothetical protein